MPLKVLDPFVHTRIEQRSNPAGDGIDRGEIGPFVPVALGAAEREIVGRSRATMLPRDYVVDFVGKWDAPLR